MKQASKNDYKVIVEYEGTLHEGGLTTHKKACKEAIRLQRMGHKAKVLHVSCQSLLPHG